MATTRAPKHAKPAEEVPEITSFGIGRIPVTNVSPVAENGRYPAKVIENEVFPISAKVFMEGHNKVSATAVLFAPSGKVFRYQMNDYGWPGEDNFRGLVQVSGEIGEWKFAVEGWKDSYHTWEHNAWIKIPNNQDIELVFAEGAEIFERWLSQPKIEGNSGSGKETLSTAEKKLLQQTVEILKDKKRIPDERLKAASAEEVHQVWNKFPLRQMVTQSPKFNLRVDRELASFCSWYQFFPRSEGAKQLKNGKWKSGTFLTSIDSLQRVKDMGFDVIYMPPIHPIGKSFRKGANNSLDATANDPGSPWAVGGELANGTFGGHDKIHPDLGTEASFKKFVKAAKDLGLEVSLDIALQASPDHPWVKQHPNWFTKRADGTIAYAENPPKKYQDIYPLNFDNDPEGITAEVLRILEYWISLGVTVMRIDNPHTKPVWFWEFVIGAVKEKHPEVIWLAEAFTLPAMMRTLGLTGYDQSHSYFLWRNTKEELTEFLNEISGDNAFYTRSTLWPTTPDNLTDFLARKGAAAHAIRAVLAAMGSTSWGIYAGYEFVENQQRKNPDGSWAGEHADSEKYQFVSRDWEHVEQFGIKQLLTKLNEIRKAHPACRNLHSLQTHATTNDEVLCFSRHIDGRFTSDGKDDTLIVLVNLNPDKANQSTVYLDWGALNLPEGFTVVDELNGKEFSVGRELFVDLAPVLAVAHIFRVVR